jgi:hypothetical protein
MKPGLSPDSAITLPAPGGSRWFFLAWVAGLLAPLLFSVPRLPHMRADVRAYWDAHWREAVQRKIDQPLRNLATLYPPDSNEAKRNFRLTVPLLARLSGLGYPATIAVRLGAWLALPALLLGLARRAGLPPAAATALALALLGTTLGTEVWRDDCLWFDNVAHTLLAVAMLAESRWLIATAAVLATFTDERAFMVLPLVFGWHWLTASARGWKNAAGALALGVSLALVLRAALMLGAGLSLPLAKVATAQILERNLALAPVAWWSAFEGGWLLLAAGFGGAWRAGFPGTLAVAVCGFAPLLACLMVEDFSRSCAYVFPAVFCATALLARFAPVRTPRLCVVAAGISLLAPNVLVSGMVQIEPPLPFWRTEIVFWPRSPG